MDVDNVEYEADSDNDSVSGRPDDTAMVAPSPQQPTSITRMAKGPNGWAQTTPGDDMRSIPESHDVGTVANLFDEVDSVDDGDVELVEVTSDEFYASDSNESTSSVVTITLSAFQQGVVQSSSTGFLHQLSAKDLGRGLRNAARRGDVNSVREFLRHGADTTSESPSGMTAFHIAVYCGYVEAARALLEGGVDACSLVNGDVDVTVVRTAVYQPGARATVTFVRPKPLYLAALRQNLELVELLQVRCTCDQDSVLLWALKESLKDVVHFLVNNEVGIDQLHPGNREHLELVALSGNETLLRGLLPRNPTTSDAEPFAKALQNAVKSESLPCVRLLHRYLNLNLAGSDITPTLLPIAATCGDQAMVELLLELGVDAEMELNGMLPLHFALAARSYACARLLLRHTPMINQATAVSRDSPLHLAVLAQSLELVDLLLSHGASPGVVNDYRATAVHIAAGNSEHDILVKLLSHGAPVDRSDKAGKTPLILAMLNRDAASTRILLQPRTLDAFPPADPNYQGEAGYTALHVAAAVGWDDGLTLLLRAGADVNSVDHDLQTPIHSAALRGMHSSISTLLAYGANPRARDCTGGSPLHCLAGCPDLTDDTAATLIRLLADAGCELGGVRAGRRTPLHDAVWEGNEPLVRQLLLRGCDPNRKSNYGQTPLHFAVIRQNSELVPLLLSQGASSSVCDMDGESPIFAVFCPYIIGPQQSMIEPSDDDATTMLRIFTEASVPEEVLRNGPKGRRLLDVAAEAGFWSAAAHIVCHNGMFTAAQRDNLFSTAEAGSDHDRWDPPAVAELLQWGPPTVAESLQLDLPTVRELLRSDPLIEAGDEAYIGALCRILLDRRMEYPATLSVIIPQLARICAEKGILEGPERTQLSLRLREWLGPYLV